MATICFASAHLQPINEALGAFDQLYQELHGLIVIKVGDLDWVYKYVNLPESPTAPPSLCRFIATSMLTSSCACTFLRAVHSL